MGFDAGSQGEADCDGCDKTIYDGSYCYCQECAHQRIAELRRELDAERSAGMNDWRTRCLAAEATLDASEDPAVYVSWQRAANRAASRRNAGYPGAESLLRRLFRRRVGLALRDGLHARHGREQFPARPRFAR